MSIRPLQQPNGATLKCVQRVRETHIFDLKRVEQAPTGASAKIYNVSLVAKVAGPRASCRRRCNTPDCPFRN
jgi:hypothetical protein